MNRIRLVLFEYILMVPVHYCTAEAAAVENIHHCMKVDLVEGE